MCGTGNWTRTRSPISVLKVLTNRLFKSQVYYSWIRVPVSSNPTSSPAKTVPTTWVQVRSLVVQDCSEYLYKSNMCTITACHIHIRWIHDSSTWCITACMGVDHGGEGWQVTLRIWSGGDANANCPPRDFVMFQKFQAPDCSQHQHVELSLVRFNVPLDT